LLLNGDYHQVIKTVLYYSKEYDKVADEGIKTWKLARYSLIDEYKDKPALPPPLIVIGLLWQVIIKIYKIYRLRRRDG